MSETFPPYLQPSPRLDAFLAGLVAGQTPNAGRFCGNCFTPLATGNDICPHCGKSTAEVAYLERLPRGLIDVYLARRNKEGLAVRLIFYTTLLIGIIVSALVIGFLPFWWNVVAFTVSLGAAYVLSANLANTVGDALGYRWGQRAAERKWQQIALSEGQQGQQTLQS